MTSRNIGIFVSSIRVVPWGRGGGGGVTGGEWEWRGGGEEK